MQYQQILLKCDKLTEDGQYKKIKCPLVHALYYKGAKDIGEPMKLSFNMIPEIRKIFDEGRDGVD